MPYLDRAFNMMMPKSIVFGSISGPGAFGRHKLNDIDAANSLDQLKVSIKKKHKHLLLIIFAHFIIVATISVPRKWSPPRGL